MLAKASLVACLALASFSVSAQTLHLGSPNSASVGHGYAPSDHVPVALTNAKTIFLSNAGGDSGLFPHPFTGDPNRGYDGLYSMLKAAGQHQLVDDPSQADLVLELQLNAPSGPAGADKQKGASDPLPEFRLVIYDRKSHYILWAVTETIEEAALQKTHDKNFDQALSNIAYDFEQITNSVPAKQQ